MSDPTAGSGRAGDDSPDAALEGLLHELIEDWKRGTPHPLRAYLDRRPGLDGRPDVIIELINQEIVLRQMRGETPRPVDYLAEFPELTESLERLFEVHALAPDLIDRTDDTLVASPFAGAWVPRRADARMPEIPGYEIERFLGRGGMGVVYLARHLGLNRRVALKRLQESRQDDPGLVARFRREAEAAARCQHPNLVQIHDVGEHDGELYLALEFVAGGHLGRAVAGEPQPPRKAAELVEILARAIDHAHAQGVVHRDLKPANVLLTPDGQPKITDFGLAKLKDSPTRTEVGAVLGTLAYMAPEQVQARSGDIGPRTDIHALGAILYEALTGRPPYRAETPERILHAILSEAVEPPSVPQPGVPRDLEAICLKCLEKEPSRRYATAADLAEDLRRFLDGRPTAARPASAAERCLRWCRRNRAAVAALAILLLLTTLSAWQAYRATIAERTAQTQRERAESEAESLEAVTGFVTKGILGQASVANQGAPGREPDPSMQVRTALDLASENVGQEFANKPKTEASVRLAIGEAYRGLGLHKQARPHLERALEMRRALLGEQDRQTLIAMRELGVLSMQEDKLAEAERLLVPAMEGLLAARGISDVETLTAMNAVGALYVYQENYEAAIERLSPAVAGFRKLRGPEQPETLEATNDLAMALLGKGRPEEAEDLLAKAAHGLEAAVGAKHPGTLSAKQNLAIVRYQLGKSDEAERSLIEVLKVQQEVLGDSHPATLNTMATMAGYYLLQTKYADAERILLEALKGCQKSLDRNHLITNAVLANLATLYVLKGDLETAGPYLIESVVIARTMFGPDHLITDRANGALGRYFQRTREFASAEPYLRDHREYTIRHTPDAAERYVTEGRIGLCLLDRKARAEAERSLRLARDWIAPRIHDVEPAGLAEFRNFETGVVQFYEEAGDKAQAETWKARLMDLDFPEQGFEKIPPE